MQIFEKIDSTQIESKRQIDTKHLIIEDSILAKQQTSGITTKKNIPWESKEGDLTISMILNIDFLLKKGNILINHIPFCVSLAMLKELLDAKQKSKSNFEVLLKWPNDFLINTDNEYKKIGGVMCDNYKGHFIIGFTCNLISNPAKTQHFPATNLLKESGIKLDCISMAERLVEDIKKNIDIIQKYGFSSIKEQWKQHAYMINKQLILKDNDKIFFKDITNDGYILGEKSNCETRIIISSDEVIGGENKIYNFGVAKKY